MVIAFGSVQVALIGHDAGHLAIFKSARANLAAGWLCWTLVLGIGFPYWFDRHSRHHSSTNDLANDPDLQWAGLVAYSDDALRARPRHRWLMHYQALLGPIYTLGLAFAFRAEGWAFALGRLRGQRRAAEIAALTASAAVWLLPSVTVGWLWLLTFCLAQVLAGLYLALAIAPNHKGMPTWPAGTRLSFLERQVLSSRNNPPHPITDFVFGGLNHQIEHHLFPTMPRSHFGQARALVRPFCREVGLPYQEMGVWQSYGLVLSELRRVGRAGRGERGGRQLRDRQRTDGQQAMVRCADGMVVVRPGGSRRLRLGPGFGVGRRVAVAALAVVNPGAGGGRGARLWSRLGLAVPCVVTERAGHARQLAAAAVESGAERVIAVGGDGTVSEVASALVGTGATLGMIPAGTGNDFAWTVGVPRDARAAAHLALSGLVRDVDVGVVERGEARIDRQGVRAPEAARPRGVRRRTGRAVAMGRYFVNVAGCGFDAEVVRRMGPMRAAGGGSLAYFTGVLRTLSRVTATELTLVLDDRRRIEHQAVGVAVANGSHYGGGLHVAPRAMVDLERMVGYLCGGRRGCGGTSRPVAVSLRRRARAVSAGGVLSVGGSMRMQSAAPGVHAQADGELVGALPVTFRIEPRAPLVSQPLRGSDGSAPRRVDERCAGDWKCGVDARGHPALARGVLLRTNRVSVSGQRGRPGRPMELSGARCAGARHRRSVVCNWTAGRTGAAGVSTRTGVRRGDIWLPTTQAGSRCQRSRRH